LLKMVALLMFWFDFDDFCILLCSSLPCPVPHLIVWSGMLFFTLKSYILMFDSFVCFNLNLDSGVKTQLDFLQQGLPGNNYVVLQLL
jgi:hypothetical protein